VSPTDQRVVRDLLEGARREDAGRDHGRATVTAKRLAAALDLQGPPAKPLAIRDRAILLLTFASGRRRAEIAGLNIEDLDFGRPGFLIVTIRKSKTDQGGAGQFVAVPRRLEHGPCAVAAVEAWLSIIEKKKGPLFVAFSPHGERREARIEGRLVAEVVKRLFRDAGASPGDVDAIGAHSLRRGFVTSADMAGATTAQIMNVTGASGSEVAATLYATRAASRSSPNEVVLGSGSPAILDLSARALSCRTRGHPLRGRSADFWPLDER
jgi:integrase